MVASPSEVGLTAVVTCSTQRLVYVTFGRLSFDPVFFIDVFYQQRRSSDHVEGRSTSQQIAYH